MPGKIKCSAAFTIPVIFRNPTVRVFLKAVHYPLMPYIGKPVIPPCVKIISVPSEICKRRQPFHADKARLPAKKFAVCDLPGACDQLPPFPRVLFFIPRPPVKGRYMLLCRKSSYFIYNLSESLSQ